ncbi:MAG TPA: NAD-dependent deacylase [Tepidisphaeraceae bacterium]|jgi:NAD-dependent deacetylase
MDPIQQVAAMIAAAQHVVVLSGAGISAESGLPTFRGAGGLWRGMNPMSLATPEAFARDAQLVWEFYNWRRKLLREAQPNPAHSALVELAAIVSRFTLITQNVDRLHHRAGSREVIELHGNLEDVLCTSCRRSQNRANEDLPPLPTCDDCGALLRPAVVWFGEALPPAAWIAAERAADHSDLFLVVGTSAVVYPAAGLIGMAKKAGANVIEVNLEQTDQSTAADVGLYGPAGEILPKLVARCAHLIGPGNVAGDVPD